MGSSRVISGPKSGAGVVKAGGPGAWTKKVTPKPSAGKFMNPNGTGKIANPKDK